MVSELVRKQIYITRDQENFLKKKAAQLDISEAEIIREALDSQAQKVSYLRRPAEKWEEEIRFIEQRMARGDLLDSNIEGRDKLYDRENSD